MPARWRIATNAEAQSSRVTPTAATGSQAGAVEPVGSGALQVSSVGVVAVTASA